MAPYASGTSVPRNTAILIGVSRWPCVPRSPAAPIGGVAFAQVAVSVRMLKARPKVTRRIPAKVVE